MSVSFGARIVEMGNGRWAVNVDAYIPEKGTIIYPEREHETEEQAREAIEQLRKKLGAESWNLSITRIGVW